MGARRILVLGAGGREHALCWQLRRASVDVEAAPGSDAIVELCPAWAFRDFEELAVKISERKIDEVIVGPEKYLAEGVADFLISKRIKVFGPTKAAAQLETDKGFAKAFLSKNKIPTARSKTVTSMESFSREIAFFDPPFVVKASGLAAGKGVWIGSDKKKALDFASDALKTHASVVLEEFLVGEELSYFVLVDGDRHLFLGGAQDHKRLLENDLGPNTGGMGAYSPVPLLTPSLQKKIEKQVIAPTLAGLKREKIYYRGFLFVGLMIVNGEPFVLEFNCRMGDPETQSLMMRLKTPVSELISRLGAGENGTAEFFNGVSLNVVVAAKGYPDHPESGFEISGLEKIPSGLQIFHSGTKRSGQGWTAEGGRLFSVNSLQPSLLECQKLIYPWIEAQGFLKHVVYRRDIGVKAYRHLVSN